MLNKKSYGYGSCDFLFQSALHVHNIPNAKPFYLIETAKKSNEVPRT